SSPEVYEKRLALSAGMHALSVAFTNPAHDASATDPDRRDASLIVDWIELGGPFDPPAAPDSDRRARVMICGPGSIGREGCARRIFAAFGRMAWRRPLAARELDRLVELAGTPWKLGDTFDAGVGLGLEAMLLSPNFVYRVELDPDPMAADPKAHPLDDHE